MKHKKIATQPKRPHDLPLKVGELSDCGAKLVHLETLDELVAFGMENGDKLKYACRGDVTEDWDQVRFLKVSDWVFAPTKVDVVKIVLRWDDIGLSCRWFDWAKEDPADWKFMVADTQRHMDELKKKNKWSAEDEYEYRRSAIWYGGNWELVVPAGWTFDTNDLLDGAAFSNHDPSLPLMQAEKMIQECIFDTIFAANTLQIKFYDKVRLDEEIEYLKSEKQVALD